MLADWEKFHAVEQQLKEQGVIERFEQENGKIRGRMMITLTDIPEELRINSDADRKCFAFDASFDFYDTSVGMALYFNPIEPVCGVWLTPRADDAEPPADEWVQFFIRTLLSNMADDGSFGVPMYTFISDTGDFTCVPTAE